MMKVNFVGPKHWRPWCHVYKMYGGWMFVFGPLVIEVIHKQ